MNKKDMKVVVNELRNDVSYPGVEDTPLHGLSLPDFPMGKAVRKEAIVQFLRWQCVYIFGDGIDENELSDMLYLLKEKKVVMV